MRAHLCLFLFLLQSYLGALTVTRIDTIDLVVNDLNASQKFYTEVLDFKKLQSITNADVQMVQLQLGDTKVNLISYLHEKGRGYPNEFQSHDKSFQHMAIVVSDMPKAYKRLQEKNVVGISIAPQRLPDWNPNASGIVAYYFKDPDNHPLEIISFPPNIGDPKWQVKNEALFQGIDHTAIVVQDTKTSLDFYEKTLGLAVKGRSENFGPEQEALNNVPGAHLRITSLRAPEGIGIELLEYITPKDGKPFPKDTKSHDLWRWQVQLQTEKSDQIPQIIHDPDGHQYLLIQKAT